MTTPTTVRKEPLPRPRVRGWWFMFAAFAALIALPIYAVSSLLRIRPETRILQSATMEVVAPVSDWHRQVDVTVGPIGLGLARLVTALGDVDDVACTALRAIRDVQISVYQARRSSPRLGGATILAATAAFDTQSWHRVVAVLDGDDAVAVFVPDDLDGAGSIEVCVVVCNDGMLVVAATCANLDALAPLISQVTARHRGDW